ncbi:MAG TPA: DinB family protein [Sediminibacterium sp.]|nr:DinB family protein [Sediminibacterium sp.]
MKSFFKELFLYNTHANQELIAALGKPSGYDLKQSTKLLGHILNAHQRWNDKFLPQATLFDPWEIHAIQALADIDRRNLEQSMRILDEVNLDQPVQYTTRNGQAFNNSARDILFHIIHHSNYHRAQIATEFRHAGLEPVITDYIFYKMTNR